jgi:hypothetical protein
MRAVACFPAVGMIGSCGGMGGAVGRLNQRAIFEIRTIQQLGQSVDLFFH